MQFLSTLHRKDYIFLSSCNSLTNCFWSELVVHSSAASKSRTSPSSKSHTLAFSSGVVAAGKFCKDTEYSSQFEIRSYARTYIRVCVLSIRYLYAKRLDEKAAGQLRRSLNFIHNGTLGPSSPQWTLASFSSSSCCGRSHVSKLQQVRFIWKNFVSERYLENLSSLKVKSAIRQELW